jgi:hypothetical protein
MSKWSVNISFCGCHQHFLRQDSVVSALCDFSFFLEGHCVGCSGIFMFGCLMLFEEYVCLVTLLLILCLVI